MKRITALFLFLLSSCGQPDHQQFSLLNGGLNPGEFDPVCKGVTFEEKLSCIKDLEIVSYNPHGIPTPYADVRFPQPVDHHHLDGAWFKQRLIIENIGEERPVVLQTSGYNIFAVSLSELAKMFSANQIQVEHRYFAKSLPSTDPNWEFLTIAQSAADFHRITVAFKNIYKKSWVNTGASKGGMTSVYYRRFYPNDVDGTVAYVAPHSMTQSDPRYVSFMNKVGGDTFAACRAKLEGLQKSMLTKRKEVEALLEGTYTRVGGLDVGFEHAIIEMPFVFFQYKQGLSACEKLPEPSASAAKLAAFLQDVNDPNENFDDKTLNEFGAYFFQAGRELGWPGSKVEAIKAQLQHLKTYQMSTYLPDNLAPSFSVTPMQDIKAWMQASSSKMMFIYGELDPWSGGMFNIREGKDSFRYVIKNGNHGSLLKDLTTTDKKQAKETLQRWFNDSGENENSEWKRWNTQSKTLEELEALTKHPSLL